MDRVISFLAILSLAAAAGYMAFYALKELRWLPQRKRRISFSFRLPPEMVVLLMVLVSRGLIYLFGGMFSDAAFSEIWSGADTEHFIRISQYGYQPGTEYENLIVFYPLFPMLMKLFTYIFGSPALSGILLSDLALCGACLMLYRLSRECGLSSGAGYFACAFLLFFPYAVFLQSCYTESLFLFLTIGCALMLKRGKWIGAGIFGLFASLTRVQGIVCLVMAIYELVYQWRNEQKKPDWKAAFLLLIPSGFGIYLLLNKLLYGSAFAYMAFEKAAPWYQGTDWFWNNLAQHYQMALEYPYLGVLIYVPQILLFFGVLGLLALGTKEKIRTSFMLYGGVFLLMSYTASWMISGGRYMLSVFPMYLVLGKLAKKRPLLGAVLLLSSAALMLFYTYCFVRNEAVM